jgi:hypothetical protein
MVILSVEFELHEFTVTVAEPVFPVPVPPPVTDTIEYVEVDVGLTDILTGLAPVAE